jgi:hypothetical protein
MELEVKLIVDGTEVDMNNFVENMIFEVNNGILKTLKGFDQWSKMELHIQK